MLDGERFGAVSVDRETVAEVLTNVVPGQLVQEQLAPADLALLGRGQDRTMSRSQM